MGEREKDVFVKVICSFLLKYPVTLLSRYLTNVYFSNAVIGEHCGEAACSTLRPSTLQKH